MNTEKVIGSLNSIDLSQNEEINTDKQIECQLEKKTHQLCYESNDTREIVVAIYVYNKPVGSEEQDYDENEYFMTHCSYKFIPYLNPIQINMTPSDYFSTFDRVGNMLCIPREIHFSSDWISTGSFNYKPYLRSDNMTALVKSFYHPDTLSVNPTDLMTVFVEKHLHLLDVYTISLIGRIGSEPGFALKWILGHVAGVYPSNAPQNVRKLTRLYLNYGISGHLFHAIMFGTDTQFFCELLYIYFGLRGFGEYLGVKQGTCFFTLDDELIEYTKPANATHNLMFNAPLKGHSKQCYYTTLKQIEQINNKQLKYPVDLSSHVRDKGLTTRENIEKVTLLQSLILYDPTTQRMEATKTTIQRIALVRGVLDESNQKPTMYRVLVDRFSQASLCMSNFTYGHHVMSRNIFGDGKTVRENIKGVIKPV